MTSPEPLRHVAVFCDGTAEDAPSVSLGQSVARERHGRLSLISAVDPAEIRQLARLLGATAAEAERRLVSARESYLAGLAADAARETRPLLEVTTGKSFVEAIRHVVKHAPDTLIKTAEPAGSGRGSPFASTEQHLLRKCPCAVWLRLPGGGAPRKGVVAAVDVDVTASAEPRTLRDLNARVIQSAAVAADLHHVPLYLLHAWEAPAEDVVQRWAVDPGAVVRYTTEVEHERHQALKRAAAEAEAELAPMLRHPFRPRLRLVRGLPRSAVPEQVHHLDADLLVMGTVARTGMAGLIIGNTAEDILNSCGCSVMTVKPAGYVSPLEL